MNKLDRVFEVESLFNKKIRLTKERWKHIIFKHPEVKKHIERVKSTLTQPDRVRKSRYDSKVWLYYKFYKRLRKYLTVVIKILNDEGFVITAYITDKIKLGEDLWKER
jgi:hypothetical protein